MRTIEHWIGGKPTSGDPTGAQQAEAGTTVVTERWPAVAELSAATYHFPTSS
jgi:hypothetical protein